MPKFTDKEREEIQRLLLSEGEKLFSTYGLKKLVVDDIAEAAKISKGSFYNFYQNKEHLFIVINFMLQNKMFSEIDKMLQQEKSTPKQTAKKAILLLLEKIDLHPMLKNLDINTYTYLRRKLPDNIFDSHALNDEKFFNSLSKYGITFKKPIGIITKTLQALYGVSREYLEDDDYKEIVSIMIDGIIEQVNE